MQTPTNKRESGRFPKWMSKELIQETVRVWSAHLKRRVEECEAIEMLQNVKRLVELVRRSESTL